MITLFGTKEYFQEKCKIKDYEIEFLAEAIAKAAHEAGIYNNEVPLDLPQLAMLCSDMAKEINRLNPTRQHQGEA